MAGPPAVMQSDPIAPIRAAVAGRYEIQREIGQGAFATVYLARDLRHDRDVAFKVLNADPSSETGELRFLREIRVLAKLQHPNVLPLIDSGHAETMLYYVMPYINGETLREKMRRERQVPLETAVAITREAADALYSAHEHGIIHRDIKPENILLSAGHPIIADFGIARAIDLAGVRQLTRTGIGSPGTPAYMSPEQLMGDGELDLRTDIYSLGCVLYEMLTGKPPFAGKDGLVRRFTEAPPLPSILRVGLPSSIDAIVAKALAREPRDRYPTAAEFAAALGSADLSSFTPFVQKPPASSESIPPAEYRLPAAVVGGTSVEAQPARLYTITPRSSPLKDFVSAPVARRTLAVGLSLAILGAVAVSWPRVPKVISTAGPVRRWEIVLPDSAPLVFVGVASLGIGRPSLTISPDGNRIVYVARSGAATLLYTRELDKLGATRLTGTEGAYFPFFSPDGRWLAFFADPYLKKVSIPDGQVITIARVNQPMGGEWTKDGRILISDDQGSKPSWVSDAGGVPSRIPLEDGVSHQWRYPQLLPDGDWALHTDWDGSLTLSSVKSARAYAITTAGVTRRDSADVSTLIFGTSPVYVSTGHIVYLSAVGGVLMAMPFDAAQRKVLGPPMPVLDGIRQEAEAGAGQFAVARDGTLLYAPGADAGRSVLVSVDAEGKLDTLPFPAAGYHGFELSPDGKQILIRVQSASGRGELWVFDVDRGSQTRVVTEGIPLHLPRWWPDSKQILFSEFPPQGGLSAPFVRQRLDGLSHRDTLIRDAMSAVPAPDGHHIAVTAWNNHSGLWLLPVDGSPDKPRQLLSESVFFTSFSPDGKWIVYNVADLPDVYASSVEHPQERYRITFAGGEEPLWSPKGDRIVYRNGQQWMAVDVSTKNGVTAGKAHVLFEGQYLNVPGWSHSFFPDGQRQLLLLGPQQQTSNRLVGVTNWFAELQRLAPPGGN
jgi:serine/threonine protein kinase/Tol biopolymer transport system component